VAEPDPKDPVAAEADPTAARVDGPAAAGRRTVLFTAVGAVLAAALLFAVVARSAGTSSSSSSGGAVSGAGNRVARFELGRAADYAKTIARDGPILFPDPQGRSRDIFVQHLGGNDWRAFEARASGAPRQCVLSWERDNTRFVDPCDGRAYPVDGTGLVSFPTTVNDKGRVIVDLGSPTGP
jgi:hypothetical protein